MRARPECAALPPICLQASSIGKPSPGAESSPHHLVTSEKRNVVDGCVARLPKKLGNFGNLLSNIRGIGYRLLRAEPRLDRPR